MSNRPEKLSMSEYEKTIASGDEQTIKRASARRTRRSFVVGGAFNPKSAAVYTAPLNDPAPDYKPGVAGLYTMLKLPCVQAALDSGRFWTGFLKNPGTIVLEFLEPIPPGLPRREFMPRLEATIEGATNALIAEGQNQLERRNSR